MLLLDYWKQARKPQFKLLKTFEYVFIATLLKVYNRELIVEDWAYFHRFKGVFKAKSNID